MSDRVCNAGAEQEPTILKFPGAAKEGQLMTWYRAVTGYLSRLGTATLERIQKEFDPPDLRGKID